MSTKSSKQSMQKVRLRRKFNHRPKFDYLEQLVMIVRIQIVFELMVILLICLFNLSLEIKPEDIFVCQFWTDNTVKNNNLALAITLVLFCPYLIFIEKTKVNLIKDSYLTVLFFHSIAAYVNTQHPQLGYGLFITLIGFVVASISQYLTMVLEQKKLIQQINMIESEDRKVIKFQQSEFASLNTFQLYDYK